MKWYERVLGWALWLTGVYSAYRFISYHRRRPYFERLEGEYNKHREQKLLKKWERGNYYS